MGECVWFIAWEVREDIKSNGRMVRMAIQNLSSSRWTSSKPTFFSVPGVHVSVPMESSASQQIYHCSGLYEAFLTTSFVIDRTLTAHYRGKPADFNGRRVVLKWLHYDGEWMRVHLIGVASTYGALCGAVIARELIGGWNSLDNWCYKNIACINIGYRVGVS